MPFTRPSIQTIVDRIESDIESRLTGNVPILYVAFLRVLARVFAGAIHILYGWLVWLANQLFWDLAEESELDSHARRWGLTRKAAAFASGTVDISGTNGTIVPSSTVFVDTNGVEVETTTGGTIAGGTLSLTAQAVLPGSEGNLAASTPLELVEPIAGVTSAEADSTGFSGGQDEEPDSELRIRIDDRIKNPPQGGTKADFEAWAKEVTGVANAWAYGNTPSAGWVTIVVKATGSNPVPSAPLLASVTANVSAKMPITTNLTVEPIDDAVIDMTIDITIEAGADQADTEAAITANLTSYLEDEAEPGVDVLISGLRNAISTTGVADYEITAIDKDSVPQSIADIPMTGYEYAVIGTITYT